MKGKIERKQLELIVQKDVSIPSCGLWQDGHFLSLLQLGSSPPVVERLAQLGHLLPEEEDERAPKHERAQVEHALEVVEREGADHGLQGRQERDDIKT